MLIGFFYASGLADADTFLVSNYDSNTIEEYSSTGVDLGLFASTGLSQPQGMAFDSSGNLYVANWGSNTIEKFSATGDNLGVFASTGLNDPCGIAFDSSGNLYVANWGSSTIEKFSPAGTDLGVFASSGLDQPAGIGFDSSGNLYAVNWGNATVEKFAASGGAGSAFASSAGLYHPAGLAFDSGGNLYVASYWGTTIEKFSSTGADLGVFASGLAGPDGLAFGSDGSLYEADSGTNTLKKIGVNGSVSVFASSGMNDPDFVAVQGSAIVKPCWAAAVSGRWSNAANWTGGVPNAIGAAAVFTVSTTAALTITLDAPQTVGSLLFGNSAAANVGYTLSGTGSNALTLDNGGNGATITVINGTHVITAPVLLNDNLTVSNAGSLTISGAIANRSNGPMGITLSGGPLVLAGGNTYSGNTAISSGTLTLAHPLAVQNSTVNLGSGGALCFAAGNTNCTLGGLAGAGGLALATAASQPVTLSVGNNNQSTTYSGNLSGAGGLAKQGAGILTLTAPNTYNGATVISGGVLQLLAPVAGGGIGIHFVGNGSSVTGAAGVVAMSNWNNESGYSFSGSTLANSSGQNSGATFSLNGATSVWSTGSANQVLNGYVYVAGNSMTFTASNIPYAKYSLYAYVGDSSTGNQEMATINGTSYYYSTEGAASTYTPITSRSSSNYQSGNYIEVDGLTGSSQTVTVAGTTQTFGGLCGVEIVNAASGGGVNLLPAATSLSIAVGATLDLGGGSQQIASLSNKTPGSGGSVINSGTAASVLTISPTGGSTTFSGMIQGGGTLGTIGLVISGSGTQVLAGSNSYTGGTAVNLGILQAAGTASLPGYSTAGKLTVAGGGMLAVSAGGSGWTSANIASLLAGNGSHFAAGSALGIDTTAGNLSYASNIAGSMGLTKLGLNSLTLTGSNTYAGPTTVNQGELIVNGSLVSPVTVNNGGTLGGSGTLSSVSVCPSGAIAPGGPLGALTLNGSLILSSGALLDYDLDTPLTRSMISCGNLSANTPLQLSNFGFSWTSNFGPGTYDLIQSNTAIPTGMLGSSTSGTIDGYPANLAVEGNNLVLNVVPEPGTLVLLGAAVVGLLGWGWRQRNLKTRF